MKRASLLGLVVSLFLALLSSACLPPDKPLEPVPPVKQTAPGEPAAVKRLTILGSSAEVEFPARLLFSLKAENNVNITDVRLHYTVDRESFAKVTSEIYIEFVPGTTVDVLWPWDMRKTGGLPTGAGLEYWWTVKDSNGNRVETTPARISFDDNRYSWQSLTGNRVTLYWYEGNQSFAGELMSAAQQALTRLSETTGAYLKKPVRIYIYANTKDLQGAMIFPQEWTGGAAFTEYGIITIGIETNNLDWGKRSIAHELTHLVIHQMTFNPYIDLPTWLEEGLAMYNEGALEAQFTNYLNMAIARSSLISVRSLSSPFSAYAAESYLSYAQSYSLVEFLLTSYGQTKMLELLTTFSQGNSYDGALEKVYDFDMDGLNSLWRDYVTRRYQETREKTAAAPSALIGTLTEPPTAFNRNLQLAFQSGVSRGI